MATKQLTVKGSTVDYAIRSGLQQIQLPQESTFIRILQKDSQSIFGHREAIVSIIYEEEESMEALGTKAREEFRSKFEFRFADSEAQIKVPSTFYDKTYVKNKEERIEYLKNYLLDKGIEKPEDDKLRFITENLQCQYSHVPVKDLEVDDVNDRGAKIYLKTYEDMMRCEAVLFHGEGCTEEEIFQVLKDRSIIKGVLRKNIQRVIACQYVGYFDIARGTPAIDDSPAEIEKFFHEDEQKEFSNMLELLTIDTRSVKDINIAERNQLLMKIGDITYGKNGYSIDGKALEKQTIEDSKGGISFGEGVYLSDNDKEVYAKRSGHIKWKDKEGFLDIEPIYIVDGNVDFGEGNIIGFVGKVLIKGDVKPKFSVIAEGDIEIQGCVEDAVIKSTEGNVMIAGQIIHKNEGYVFAKDTVHCMIATNAKIRAKNINVEKEALNSVLEAETITALGTPGVILGGEAHGKKLIKANVIGSEGGVPTKIHAGDVTEKKQQLRNLQKKSTQNQSKCKELEQLVKILKARQKTQELSTSQMTQLKKAEGEIPTFQEKIDELKEESALLRTEIEDSKPAKLEVLKILHPQVDVRIFEGRLIPETQEQFTGFRCKDGLIHRYPL